MKYLFMPLIKAYNLGLIKLNTYVQVYDASMSMPTIKECIVEGYIGAISNEKGNEQFWVCQDVHSGSRDWQVDPNAKISSEIMHIYQYSWVFRIFSQENLICFVDRSKGVEDPITNKDLRFKALTDHIHIKTAIQIKKIIALNKETFTDTLNCAYLTEQDLHKDVSILNKLQNNLWSMYADYEANHRYTSPHVAEAVSADWVEDEDEDENEGYEDDEEIEEMEEIAYTPQPSNVDPLQV